jgi:hypothetical protein
VQSIISKLFMRPADNSTVYFYTVPKARILAAHNSNQ